MADEDLFYFIILVIVDVVLFCQLQLVLRKMVHHCNVIVSSCLRPDLKHDFFDGPVAREARRDVLTGKVMCQEN